VTCGEKLWPRINHKPVEDNSRSGNKVGPFIEELGILLKEKFGPDVHVLVDFIEKFLSHFTGYI